ncbi:glycosyl hydrolase family 18 protein [Paenibacillus sp. MER TA 81-3]|uniref:glycosyl hydrolase family 18 protein n=1 Tax=Paenibacillus sp. MER TA 81-3 TaxID=2939573 RepID=UPI00203D4A4E|nr:glycosyl hydrolase family 18 protein [Paenibacillus sp. MER TA 81-3]MCM3340398.1 glycosyl hydrolase family 18 protein [Paenibacillus sp. MER TA 81-3]
MHLQMAVVRKFTTIALAVMMLFTPFTAMDSGIVKAEEAAAGAGYKVVGYYPSWGAYGRNYQVSDMDVSKVTHVNYAFADICWNGIHGNPEPTGPNPQTWTCQDANGTINVPNGTIVLGDPWIDVQKNYPGDTWDEPIRGNIKQLNKLKLTNPHLKTIISVGGWSWSNRFSDVAASAAARETFANSAVDFLRKYQFDGVDLDWEYPVGGGLKGNSARPEDKHNYTLLLQAIRDKLDAAGAVDGKTYLLTIASGASPTYANNTELGEIAKVVDWINIMTYDFNGGWQTISAHNSPLYYDPAAASTGVPAAAEFNIEAGVQGHINAGVPAGKIVLGTPFYGRGWGGCANTGNGQYQQCAGAPNVGTWEKGVFDYSDLESNYINRNGYTRYWNDVAKVPYLYNSSNGIFITYDDVESFGHKTAFIKSKQLGGAMFWDYSSDRKKVLLNKLTSDLQSGNPGGGNDTTPPSAPTNVIVTAKTATSVSLSWTASTDNVGVTGYTITYSSGSKNTPGTTATITGLTSGTAYTFTITARDAAGNVSPGTSIQVTTDSGGGTPCSAPSWGENTVYTGGQRVSYSGKIYEAKWWTQGDRPDQSGEWGVWKVIGDCAAAASEVTVDDTGGGNAPPAAIEPTESESEAEQHSAPLPADKKIIVGYWHNFDNGSGFIRLRDVSPNFDVINVAFAEPANGPKGGSIGFTPYNYTDSDFKADVKYLQSQGKKVIISIGGANGQVQLETDQARNNFVTSMKSIISTYRFDGLDIDFEGHSLYLNPGDSDFRHPTTPVITNLIAAVRDLHSHFGDSFMVTMAPETFFVQVGYSFYGGNATGADNRAGAYLPVIEGLRDILDWVQVQHYNSGSITALDDTYYAMGDADFHVAMVDMVLTGFPVAKKQDRFFAPLRPDQIVIGLPANVNSGGGFTPVSEVHKALDYAMKGQSFGGRYKLRNAAGYPGLRGLMTWSINWDRFNKFEFSEKHRAYLDGTKPNPPIPPAPGHLRAAKVTANSVSLEWDASTKAVTYEVYNGGSYLTSVQPTHHVVAELTPGKTYTFTVKAKNAAGLLSDSSNAVTVTTAADADNTPPTAPSQLQVTGKSSTSVSLSWTASTDNVGVVAYTAAYGSKSAKVTVPSADITGLNPNTAYHFTVTAYDAAGNVSEGASIEVTTDEQSGPEAWSAGTAYQLNDEVTHNGTVYKCVQSHTSLQGWEPPNVPALWKLK